MAIQEETWQHRDIMTNGIRMHYVTQGTGPLVVLLHGFLEFWYSWRHQIPFLAEHGYTVVAPDLRGYNDSDKPRKGYDVPTLLRDIVGLIRGVGEEQVSIVGHDWGGALAWAFATEYPEMTRNLIIMNAPHPQAMFRELRTFKQLRKSWYIFAFQLPWLPEVLLSRNNANAIGRMLNGSALQKAAFPPEVTAHYRKAMSKPGAMTAALNYYRQLFRHLPNLPGSSSEQEAHITAPTLVIWGEHDIALDIALTHGLEQWVDDLQLQYLPESGHWVQQEQPEQVNDLLLTFLSRT